MVTADDCAGAVMMGVVSKRAEFPLQGGQSGATLTLHPLLCAQVGMPPNWFHRRRGVLEALKAFGVGVPEDGLMEIPIPAYLLEHPSAGAVLVDTGMHGSLADGGGRERARNLGPIGRMMSRHASMRPDQTVAAQLRAHGMRVGSDLSSGSPGRQRQPVGDRPGSCAVGGGRAAHPGGRGRPPLAGSDGEARHRSQLCDG